MSWTSEFEPPPPRPILEPKGLSDEGSDLVELDGKYPAEADEGPQADSFDENEPLDPSVFDGLFDDLDGEPRSSGDNDSASAEDDTSEQEAELDAPDEIAFEDNANGVGSADQGDRADVDLNDEELDLSDEGPPPSGDTIEADTDDSATDTKADSARNTETVDADSNTDADGNTDADNNTDADYPVEAAGYENPNDDGFVITDSHRVDGLLIKSDPAADEPSEQQTNRDAAEEPVIAPQDAVTLDDAVPFDPFDPFDEDPIRHDDDDVVDSSEELLHDVIRQNPGVTDPSPEHLDSQAFNPAATQHFGPTGPGPNQPPAPAASGFEPAPPLPPIVHYDPAVTDDAVGHSRYADNSGQLIDGPGYQQAAVTGYPPVAASPQVITSPPVAEYTAPKQRKRWPAFVIATIVGATVGVVGALLLFQMFRPDPAETTAEPAAEAAADTTVEPAPNTTVEPAPNTTAAPDADPRLVVGLADLATTGRFELNTIRFESGSVRLTERSEAVLVEATEAMASQSAAPLAIDVRTFSEPTAAANQELGNRQADVLRARLIELGIPDESITITALGAAQFDPSHPVQNFVVPSSGLEPSDVRAATQATSPFAIGIDPVTNQLRPEGIVPLSRLGDALLNNDDASLSLAAYSFDQASRAGNQEMAAATAEAAAAFLVENHNIDRSRISILTPGETPYVVGAEVGSHVYLQWGEWAEISRQLNAIELDTIEFFAGSDELTPEATAALDQIVAVSGEMEGTIVVGVHSATESSDDANDELSALQAETLFNYLVAGGLPEERIRAYGAGNLGRYDGSGRQSAVAVTALP